MFEPITMVSTTNLLTIKEKISFLNAFPIYACLPDLRPTSPNQSLYNPAPSHLPLRPTTSNHKYIPHHQPLTLNMIPSPQPHTPTPPKQLLRRIPTPNHDHTNLMMSHQSTRRNLRFIQKWSNQCAPTQPILLLLVLRYYNN